MLSERFTTQLSNGTEVELFAGGFNEPVTFERRETFCSLVVQKRLTESERQVISQIAINYMC